jgi:hypothetical protein
MTCDADHELRFHASGLLVRTEGAPTDPWLARFRRFLRACGLRPSDAQLESALEDARARDLTGPHRLYVCAGGPCERAMGFDASHGALTRLAMDEGLDIARTGCQGRCKHAPVVTLRIDGRFQPFGRVITEEDRRAVFAYAGSAARADSFLVASGAADPFRIDPVHHHDEPAAQLGPAHFLLGRFRGEGRFAKDGYAFRKESLGTYEAGGRVIALRMEASYPVPEGGDDVHHALVIVGSEPRSGRLTGRAYTDGGDVREYAVEQACGTLGFDDVSPDHTQTWTRVRKTLRPTADGYEERLEVDAGEGLTRYYTVTMCRAA